MIDINFFGSLLSIYEEKKGDINMQILLDIIQIVLNIVTIVCLVKLINK